MRAATKVLAYVLNGVNMEEIVYAFYTRDEFGLVLASLTRKFFICHQSPSPSDPDNQKRNCMTFKNFFKPNVSFKKIPYTDVIDK